MNPASADHADDIKREGAGAASEIVVVSQIGIVLLATPTAAWCAFRGPLGPYASSMRASRAR